MPHPPILSQQNARNWYKERLKEKDRVVEQQVHNKQTNKQTNRFNAAAFSVREQLACPSLTP